MLPGNAFGKRNLKPSKFEEKVIEGFNTLYVSIYPPHFLMVEGSPFFPNNMHNQSIVTCLTCFARLSSNLLYLDWRLS